MIYDPRWRSYLPEVLQKCRVACKLRFLNFKVSQRVSGEPCSRGRTCVKSNLKKLLSFCGAFFSLEGRHLHQGYKKALTFLSRLVISISDWRDKSWQAFFKKHFLFVFLPRGTKIHFDFLFFTTWDKNTLGLPHSNYRSSARKRFVGKVFSLAVPQGEKKSTQDPDCFPQKIWGLQKKICTRADKLASRNLKRKANCSIWCRTLGFAKR